MKSAGSAVAKETNKEVKGQFSHLYKVMGQKAPRQSNNVLAMMQKGSKDSSGAGKKK